MCYQLKANAAADKCPVNLDQNQHVLRMRSGFLLGTNMQYGHLLPMFRFQAPFASAVVTTAAPPISKSG